MANARPVVYETEPATEWLLGEPVQKMSPKWAHAVLQLSLAALVRSWAGRRGTVGTEWRFWLEPAGEEARYLVPDVAYVSRDRFRIVDANVSDESRFAPNVAFEILSSDDRSRFVEHKIDVYLRSGTSLVVIVDLERERIRAVDERAERTFVARETFEHSAMPEFALDVTAFFAEIGSGR